MIARLKGTVEEKSKNEIVVDVQGVGYGLLVPETVLLRLPEVGHAVTLQVYTHVREDQLCLFGFLTHLERDVFEILLGASGVGPKVAIAILSALEAIQVLEAVSTENKGMFAGISGVGKKTIEKLFVEIREKCEKRLLLEKGSLGSGERRGSSGVRLAVDNAPWANDLEQALVALGYKDNDLRAVLRETMKHSGELPVFEMALKFALKLLNAGGSKMVRGTA